MQNRGLDYAGADQTMLDLLRWRGAEEIEHRSLVFDVYHNVCGNYALRALTMLSTAPIFVLWWIKGVRFLMAQDPTISAKPRWRDWLRAARQYRVPGPWLVPMVAAVPKPLSSAQPSPQLGGVHEKLAMDYLEQSPAARAARKRAEAELTGSEG